MVGPEAEMLREYVGRPSDAESSPVDSSIGRRGGIRDERGVVYMRAPFAARLLRLGEVGLVPGVFRSSSSWAASPPPGLLILEGALSSGVKTAFFHAAHECVFKEMGFDEV